METKQSIAESVLLGIELESKFVSQEDIGTDRSKWWVERTCRLLLNGREILRSPFSQGIGYIQGMNVSFKSLTVYEFEQLEQCLKDGQSKEYRVVAPELDDFLHCIVSDTDVINYSGFEDWAESFGCDTDSRSAEKIYKQSLEIALRLQSEIGQSKLAELREAYQDY